MKRPFPTKRKPGISNDDEVLGTGIVVQIKVQKQRQANALKCMFKMSHMNLCYVLPQDWV